MSKFNRRECLTSDDANSNAKLAVLVNRLNSFPEFWN
jgi:hypothetical protein